MRQDLEIMARNMFAVDEIAQNAGVTWEMLEVELEAQNIGRYSGVLLERAVNDAIMVCCDRMVSIPTLMSRVRELDKDSMLDGELANYNKLTELIEVEWPDDHWDLLLDAFGSLTDEQKFHLPESVRTHFHAEVSTPDTNDEF